MITTVLLDHVRRYPEMEPTDAVKLLYQSEFGGGHLIREETACLERLQEEYRNTPQSRHLPLWEDIGSGMIRVNLGALDAAGLGADQLGRIFLRSAQTTRGSMKGFQKKLDILKALTTEGKLPFSPEELENYLRNYEAAGYPPVSHSEAYRKAYHPAYRVVDKRNFTQDL